MPLWRASDFSAGFEFSFCSWIWRGIANDAKNKGEKKQQQQKKTTKIKQTIKKPNQKYPKTNNKKEIQNLSVFQQATLLPKWFAISFESRGRCWLFLNVAFQVQIHFMPMFAVRLSTSWTYGTWEEYVSNHHIWQNFDFWDFKLIPHLYLAVSVLRVL